MPWGGIATGVGAAVGGIAGLIGSGQSQANAAKLNQLNYEHQKEFAQNGIRWRVADAKAAGLHPLAALGAQGASYSPSAVIGDSPDYSFLKDMGQGIGRAMDAKRTQQERVEQEEKSNALFNEELKGKQLQNQETETRIQQMKWDMAMDAARNAERSVRTQQQVPPMSSLAPDGSLMPGQSNATSPGGIESKPAEIVVNEPGRPGQERGSITELGFSRTNDGGYVPVMSNDAKQRYEEDIVGEIGWNIRNRLPTFLDRQDIAPPRSWLSNPNNHWSWRAARGAWYERSGPKPRGLTGWLGDTTLWVPGRK